MGGERLEVPRAVDLGAIRAGIRFALCLAEHLLRGHYSRFAHLTQARQKPLEVGLKRRVIGKIVVLVGINAHTKEAAS